MAEPFAGSCTTSDHHTVGVCCAPKPTVQLRAFLDENGNGARDATKAQAEYAGNPVTLDKTRDVALTLATPSR